MNLPEKIFVTGVAGSRWNSIIQVLEHVTNANISDRLPHREWHSPLSETSAQNIPDGTVFTGHYGSMFGLGQEFAAWLDNSYLDSAWAHPGGPKFIKSHDWAYQLHDIKKKFPDAWILMVYRPDLDSFGWWSQVGGFNITYPTYKMFNDHSSVYNAIVEQNKHIMNFSTEQLCTWSHFTNSWVEENFGVPCSIADTPKGVLVTLVK